MILADAARPFLYLSDGRVLEDTHGSRVPGYGIIDLGDVVMADVDGDGDLDLLIARSWGCQVACLRNDGFANFTDVTATCMPTTNPAANTFYTCVPFDVDHDGDLDLFVGAYAANRLFRNDGHGHFTDATGTALPPGNARAYRAWVGDLDGDSVPDLVTLTDQGMAADTVCLRNDGAGHFAPFAVPLLLADDSTYGVGFADLDGDGRMDLLARGAGLLLLGGPTGFHDASATHLPAHPPGTFQLVDLDGDGDLDVIGARFLLTNDGTGHFADRTSSYPIGISPAMLLGCGDFDGDGDPDLVAAPTWYLAPSGAPRTGPLQLLANHHRWLGAASAPVRGQNLMLDLATSPGYAVGAAVALPFAAFEPATVPIPPFGCLGLDVATMAGLPLVLLPAPAGTGTLAVAVPNVPQLANRKWFAQALTIDAAGRLGLTNCLGLVVQ